jgi:molybdopterin-guanine dinucleotide biosynthesis protein A
MIDPTAPILCVILAGGQASRMGGGDKCLRVLGGQPILTHVINRLQPQVERIVINANGDPARFQQFNLPVVADSIPDFAGPLAGVLAGLDWAAENLPGCEYVVSVPGDGPFLPRDVVRRLRTEVSLGAEIATAASAGQVYPVVGFWPVALREALRQALTAEGVRKVDAWTAGYKREVVQFSALPVNPFFNANTPEDLAEAERLLKIPG